MPLGERIRSLRKAAGLSQDELGRRLGTTQRVISTWEVDRTEIPASEIPALADALGVKIVDFYTAELISELRAGSGKTQRLVELMTSLERALELGPERMEINVVVRGEPERQQAGKPAEPDAEVREFEPTPADQDVPPPGARFSRRFYREWQQMSDEERGEFLEWIEQDQRKAAE